MQDQLHEQVKDAVDDTVLSIFRRNVKKRYRDSVKPEARLQADLDMDSLGVLSAMLVAEEELKLSIFPLQGDVGEIRTVRDIINIVRSVVDRP
jgi:acyl carrier protein